MNHRLVAIAAPGLEGVLAEELVALGGQRVRAFDGAVRFEGDTAVAYRACLRSRVASRILLVLRRFPSPHARALYGAVRTLRWEEHLGPDDTLRVDFVGTSDTLRNEQFSAQKVKDAVVDRIREVTGDRPSIDLEAPDVRLHVHLDNGHGQVALDLSGAPLHERGWGRDGGPAPLKETLAAGILRLAGWPRAASLGMPLVDPMAGSGTLVIEAAGMALGHAAGRHRTFGFERWRGFEPDVWQAVKAEPDQPLTPSVGIFASDRDPEQVARLRENADKAGVGDVVRVATRELADAKAPSGEPGLVVTNPPYGERLADEDGTTLRLLGDILRQRFLGYHAWILAGSTKQAKTLGLRPESRIPLFNGPLDARLLHVPIAADKARPRRDL